MNIYKFIKMRATLFYSWVFSYPICVIVTNDICIKRAYLFRVF